MKTASFETLPFEEGVHKFFEDEDIECWTFKNVQDFGVTFLPGMLFTKRQCDVRALTSDKRIWLKENEYASMKDTFSITGGEGIYMRIKREFVPMNLQGGPLEFEGRLKYIDGCTDSLLLPPVKKGDPCLNFLHFPPFVTQTQHTHPSHRIGMVTRGQGKCITPFGDLPLVVGNVFIIKKWDGVTMSEGLDGKLHPDGTHSFETNEGYVMDVVAWHPDSDFGATDEEHPMINKTIVQRDGVAISAKHLKDIQTR